MDRISYPGYTEQTLKLSTNDSHYRYDVKCAPPRVKLQSMTGPLPPRRPIPSPSKVPVPAHDPMGTSPVQLQMAFDVIPGINEAGQYIEKTFEKLIGYDSGGSGGNNTITDALGLGGARDAVDQAAKDVDRTINAIDGSFESLSRLLDNIPLIMGLGLAGTVAYAVLK